MNDRLTFRFFNTKANKYMPDQYVDETTVFLLARLGGDKYIIEQCTGLKDKNGNFIYEGDIILSNLDYGGTYFVIVGDVRGYCYDAVAVCEYKQYLENGKETCGGLSSTAYHIITDHGPCEVVGNIHENPELMEDK